MSETNLLVNASHPSQEVRFAIIHEDPNKQPYLENLFIEHPGAQKKSNIYKGVVTRVEPSLQAAFVNYGATRHGFLPFKEIAQSYYADTKGDEENLSITEVVKEGQEVLVQIDKEERGNKGAALSTIITLAGSYLVLMPNNPRAGGISRRIEGDDRDELRDILNSLTYPHDMGLIIRTAGVGKSHAELQWDLDILLNLWDAIQSAYHERPAPFLVHQESDIVGKAVRDYLRKDISNIVLDNEELYEQTKQHILQVRPEFASRVHLYQDPVPLFTQYQIEKQIETAYENEVRLPSGGSIVIQQTEALVSIDVNSSKDTKGGHIEQTALNTNTEAAAEVARQLRLRDLGGLIVVDFIDMMSFDNQRAVVEAFEREVQSDKARVQYGRISRFGLLEISRQRLRPSLLESSHVICPRCHGEGNIRSTDSLANFVLRLIREDAIKQAVTGLLVQLPVSVATYLLNEQRSVIEDIESSYQVRVQIIPNQYLETPDYRIERQYRDQRGSAYNKPSYKQVHKPESNEFTQAAVKPRAQQEQAAVKMEMPTRPAGLPTGEQGLLRKLWSSLFSGEKTEQKSSSSSGRSDRRRPHYRDQQGYNRPQRHKKGKSQRHRGKQNRGKSQRPQKEGEQKHRAQDTKQAQQSKSSQKPKQEDKQHYAGAQSGQQHVESKTTNHKDSAASTGNTTQAGAQEKKSSRRGSYDKRKRQGRQQGNYKKRGHRRTDKKDVGNATEPENTDY